ncbi:sirohydrochlorin chelatase [Kocuria tytonis]|uniref:Cobalamin biosynthesis protein CbiX n=1 Tax=Kocuria tytonis TaxID=2054280 RepID=A0A495A3Y0_9MICC|nr:CbiX/SirB N-terminal domain-containing protein [Kocuria tytonis]RKQ34171.1 hypothetical protein C1C97_010060 [Kocuria tytonis]
MGRVSTSSETPPVLLACAHGTRDPRGQRAVAALVAAVRETLPHVRVVDTWVDVQEPDLDSRTAQHAAEDAVVVPLLLSAGYHVFVDMARAVEAAAGHRVAAALGPDRRLATVMARRLTEALAAAGGPALDAEDRVVMVAAGSSDARAGRDCRVVAGLLAAELGHPVTTAYLSAAHPTLQEAVAAARQDTADAAAAGRVLLVPYLLAPGYFHGRALAAGADVTAEPLLVHPGAVPPELVELVVEHYREASAAA